MWRDDRGSVPTDRRKTRLLPRLLRCSKAGGRGLIRESWRLFENAKGINHKDTKTQRGEKGNGKIYGSLSFNSCHPFVTLCLRGSIRNFASPTVESFGVFMLKWG